MAAGEALRRGWVDEVQRWAAMKRTGVTLRYMMEFGSRCQQKIPVDLSAFSSQRAAYQACQKSNGIREITLRLVSEASSS
jgi:hypothetical protein